MNPRSPNAISIWICICAYLSCAGWILSALHELNPAGYAVVMLICLAALWVWWKKSSAQLLPRAGSQKLRRRFRRPIPAIFLLSAAALAVVNRHEYHRPPSGVQQA